MGVKRYFTRSVLLLAISLVGLVSPASAGTPLTPPSPLTPLVKSSLTQGVWSPAGRLVNGTPAIYTTSLILPASQAQRASIAWIDPTLVRAQIYSGSLSPGGFGWKYSAPISHQVAQTLVAAFNGGFLLKASEGGYFSEGKLVAPLRKGAASLVIYKDGSMTVGVWGSDVNMSSNVASVRQNLRPLVRNAKPVAGLVASDISTWGQALNNVVATPRSGLGVTASGALVYVEAPMNIVQLAQVLVRAGAVTAMTLDMNPLWPIFATYKPSLPNGYATPGNGTDLAPSMRQTPARFFSPAYTRDFIALFAR